MRRVRFGNGNVVQPTLRLAHLGVAILGACLFAGCLSAQYTEECFVGALRTPSERLAQPNF